MFGTKITLDPSATVTLVHIDNIEDNDHNQPSSWIARKVQRMVRRVFLLFPDAAEAKFKAYHQANSSVKATRYNLTRCYNINSFC